MPRKQELSSEIEMLTNLKVVCQNSINSLAIAGFSGKTPSTSIAGEAAEMILMTSQSIGRIDRMIRKAKKELSEIPAE